MNQIPNIEETHNTREVYNRHEHIRSELGDHCNLCGEPMKPETEKDKCRRCGLSLKECPRTRWKAPLCVVNGVEWDEHVIGLSTLHHQLQKAREQKRTEISKYIIDHIKPGMNAKEVIGIIGDALIPDHSELDRDKV